MGWLSYTVPVVLPALVAFALLPTPVHGEEGAITNNTMDPREERYQVASWNFHEVQTMLIVSSWLLLASLAKIGFHYNNKLSSIIPESCMLIVLGIVLGILIVLSGVSKEDANNYFTMSANTFFYFMLPPIVFDSGYHMPNKPFFANIGSILTYAILGTILNTVAISFTLYGLMNALSVDLGIWESFVFGSLISAVDPVAVLAVFEEIHINELLYIIVFGESLLNDAIAVVLYTLFSRFKEIEFNCVGYDHCGVQPIDIAAGFLSFLVVGIGGTFIGIVFGLLTAFITRWTSHIRVIEPVFIFLLAYLSYLTADMVKLSGIMAAVFCGISMRRYVCQNVSRKSQTTIKYALKMLASLSETTVFMLLGVTTVETIRNAEWSEATVAFLGFTILFCTLFRPIFVVMQTAVLNRYRTYKLTFIDQFIMSYGGLRGAIAFALCLLLNEEYYIVKYEDPEKADFNQKQMFLVATLGLIFFTVFIQGATIKPLVEKLKVKKATNHKPNMNEKMATRILEHTTAVVEDILGIHGYHWFKEWFDSFDSRYLTPFLVAKPGEAKSHDALTLSRTFTRIKTMEALQMSMEKGSIHSDVMRMRKGGDSNAAFDNFVHMLVHSQSESSLNKDDEPMVANQAIRPADTQIDINILERKMTKRDMDDTKMHHLLDESFIQQQHRRGPARHHRYKDTESYLPRLPNHHMQDVDYRRILDPRLQTNGAKKTATEAKPKPTVSFANFGEDNPSAPLLVAEYEGMDRTTSEASMKDEYDDDDGGITMKPISAKLPPIEPVEPIEEPSAMTLPWMRTDDVMSNPDFAAVQFSHDARTPAEVQADIEVSSDAIAKAVAISNDGDKTPTPGSPEIQRHSESPPRRNDTDKTVVIKGHEDEPFVVCDDDTTSA